MPLLQKKSELSDDYNYDLTVVRLAFVHSVTYITTDVSAAALRPK